MLELDLLVHRRQLVAEGVVELDLRAPDGAALPSFDAGSHVDVQAADGVIRQYSLSNDPSETHRYVLGVLLDKASRGGSAGVHRWQDGHRVRIGRPRNNFALRPGPGPVVLVAGGIGITPLKSMAHVLWREGREFRLHYFARSLDRAAFWPELQAAPFAHLLQAHFDDDGGGLPLPAHAMAPHADAQVYVCGPEGFIERVTQDARAAGVASDAVHVEHFAGVANASQDDAGFTVEAVRSGRTVHVRSDQSIGQALEAAGVHVLLSCEQGLCGTCLTHVLGGEPEHRDSYLTDEEKAANAKIAICCSRSRTPVLKLDI
jgi:vanillate O-demethylase ferredoxin subunit